MNHNVTVTKGKEGWTVGCDGYLVRSFWGSQEAEARAFAAEFAERLANR